MFAALVAGLLILLIALTLIVLKLGFLLLLIAGPFFLIIGTHPGFGRVIAIRWFEMLVGVLMKQVAIAIVLSVLLYCYSLIMGTSDTVLPWALKILMIALVTAAVFIYRKPFQHLFSAVGYGTIGSQERAEYSLREAGATFRRSTLDAATVAVPGVAGYRAARWARRNPGQAAVVAAGVASGGAAAGAAAAADAATGAGTVPSASSDAYASRFRPDASPSTEGDGEGEARSGSRRVVNGPAGRARRGPGTCRRRTAAPGAWPRRWTCRRGPADRADRPEQADQADRADRRAPPGRLPAGRAAPAARRQAVLRARAAAPQPRDPRHHRRPRSARRATDPRRRSPAAAPGRKARPDGPAHGPAWPSSGWPAAGARQRSTAGPKPNPAPPPAAPARPAPARPAPARPAPARPAPRPPTERGQDEPSARPFWLRPVRRDK